MKKNHIVFVVLRFIHRVYPSLLPLIVISQMINSAIFFINIIFSSRILDELIAGAGYEKVFSHVLWMVLLDGGLVLLYQGLQKFVNIRKYLLNERINNEIALKALVMDYELLEKKETMDHITRAKEGMQSHGGPGALCDMLEKITGTVINMIYSLILVIPVFIPQPGKAGGYIFNSLAGLFIILAVLAVQLFVMYRCNKKYGEIQQKNFEANVDANTRLGYFLSPIFEYAQGKDIRMARLDIPYVKRLREGNKGILISMFSLHRKGEKLAAVNTFFSAVFSIACYVYVGVKALLGLVTVGNVARYVSAFTKFGTALGDFVDIYVSLQISCGYMSHFVDFMEIENHKYDGTLPIEKRDDGEYEFEFRDVSFSYPNSEKPVLDHVSFQIKIGGKMALVGPNGAGKTTFIKLLCRLYDPTEGEILLNGIDIRYYDYNEYVNLFSVVFQDFKLFSRSIAENVAASGEFEEEKVTDCLEKAGFGGRLEEMEKGIHTNLFQLEEDGMEISGGEAQKIAIARALYKDAPLVILDEPTSALDPVSEYEIYRSFDGLVEEKTAIYISHRMSSCRFCDQILVFDGGRIIQSGSHEKLLQEEDGLYYEMWSAQAQYYR